MRCTGLTLAALEPVIERAFKLPRLEAVALSVNSPGGSAAQSDLICRRIRDLAAEKEVPIFAFCEDVAASGGYWLACAADEIYVRETSIVGSMTGSPRSRSSRRTRRSCDHDRSCGRSVSPDSRATAASDCKRTSNDSKSVTS